MITFNTAIKSLQGNFKSNSLSFKKSPDTPEVSAAIPRLDTDKFEKTTAKKASNPINTSKIKNNNSLPPSELTQQTLDLLKKEKVLPEELHTFLEPEQKSDGEKVFSLAQVKLIDAAQKRMNYYMDIASQLENDAKDAEDEVLEQVQNIFGGKEGLGKHVVIRTKSQKSIFNKLVKEFKDEHFYGKMMDRFSKEAFKKTYSKLTPNDYKRIADTYFNGKTFTKEQYDVLNKPYAKLGKDEKKLILMAIKEKSMAFKPAEIEECIKIFKPSSKEHDKAVNYVRDLVGTRLILPTGSIFELEEVEKHISKAIRYNKIKITKMSNYHDNHILPYIKYETARKWKDAMPGMVLVETSKVRKRNGYTTTQLNIVHPLKNKDAAKAKDLSKSKISKKAQNIEKNKLKTKTIFGELQIRTKRLNDIGQIEHLIYDILEEKDISKDIPALREYYDSIGIEKAVNEVFNDDKKEENYIRYENSMYHWTRNKETNKNRHMKANYIKPTLAMFELKDYEILSFDSLAKIDKKAEMIKQEFYKSQQKEHK